MVVESNLVLVVVVVVVVSGDCFCCCVVGSHQNRNHENMSGRYLSYGQCWIYMTSIDLGVTKTMMLFLSIN